MRVSISGQGLWGRDAASMSAVVRRVCKAAGAGDVAVSVVFVSDRDMRALNRRWRGKDKTTDVLSFSAVEGELVAGDDALLGDLVVAKQTAVRQARQQRHAVVVEVGVLVAHGLMHLVGLDHERSAEEAAMQLSAEMNVLAHAGLPVDAALSGRGHFR